MWCQIGTDGKRDKIKGIHADSFLALKGGEGIVLKKQEINLTWLQESSISVHILLASVSSLGLVLQLISNSIYLFIHLVCNSWCQQATSVWRIFSTFPVSRKIANKVFFLSFFPSYFFYLITFFFYLTPLFLGFEEGNRPSF